MAAPAYARLAGPIMGAARETGYGRRRWREDQFADSQARFKADLGLRREQLEQAAELQREQMAETRGARESARAFAYEELAQRAQGRDADREAAFEMEDIQHQNRAQLDKMREDAAQGRLTSQQKHQLKQAEDREAAITARREEDRAWLETDRDDALLRAGQLRETDWLNSHWNAYETTVAGWRSRGLEFGPQEDHRRKNIIKGIGEVQEEQALGDDERRAKIRELFQQLRAIRPTQKVGPTIKEQYEQDAYEIEEGPMEGALATRDANGTLKLTMPPKEGRREKERANREVQRVNKLKVAVMPTQARYTQLAKSRDAHYKGRQDLFNKVVDNKLAANPKADLSALYEEAQAAVARLPQWGHEEELRDLGAKLQRFNTSLVSGVDVGDIERIEADVDSLFAEEYGQAATSGPDLSRPPAGPTPSPGAKEFYDLPPEGEPLGDPVAYEERVGLPALIDEIKAMGGGEKEGLTERAQAAADWGLTVNPLTGAPYIAAKHSKRLLDWAAGKRATPGLGGVLGKILDEGLQRRGLAQPTKLNVKAEKKSMTPAMQAAYDAAEQNPNSAKAQQLRAALSPAQLKILQAVWQTEHGG